MAIHTGNQYTGQCRLLPSSPAVNLGCKVLQDNPVTTPQLLHPGPPATPNAPPTLHCAATLLLSPWPHKLSSCAGTAAGTQPGATRNALWPLDALTDLQNRPLLNFSSITYSKNCSQAREAMTTWHLLCSSCCFFKRSVLRISCWPDELQKPSQEEAQIAYKLLLCARPDTLTTGNISVLQL